MFTSLKLPAEVAERVIDTFSDDSGTLRSFTLSCHTFLPRSRLHLFARICICTVKQMRSASEFLDNRPWLQPLVRSVTITAEPDGKAPHATFEVVPISLFTKLPNLSAWRIIDSCGHQVKEGQYFLHPATLSGFRHYGTKIRCLTISQLEFPSVADLARLLLSFPNLRSWNCEACKISGKGIKKSVEGVLQRKLVHQFCHLNHLLVSSLYTSWAIWPGSDVR